MSTAVMSTSAVYEFGDILLKSHTTSSCNNNNSSNNNINNNGNNQNNINLATTLQQHHQKVLKWGFDSAQKAVGSQLNAHQALARRNSNPVPIGQASIAVTASLVSSLFLDNISEHQVESQSLQVAHRKLDRSQSEPAGPLSALKFANVNTSRYKTELCRPYEESGSCKYGDKCQFAHGAHELRNLVRHPKYKTELCRTFHTIGFCPYGPRCHFIHNDEEIRNKALPMSPSPTNRPKPLSLSSMALGGSTGDTPSPTSSLSQSPTTSIGSFFSSEPDIFSSGLVSMSPPPSASSSVNTAFSFGQDFSPLVPLALQTTTPPPSPSDSSSPRESPPPNSPESRLPIFNMIRSNSSGTMRIGDFVV